MNFFDGTVAPHPFVLALAVPFVPVLLIQLLLAHLAIAPEYQERQ